MGLTRKSHATQKAWFDGKRALQHWYRDNQVYFITARCRGRVPAFALEPAKIIFWDRFEHYTKQHGFVPWITSLIDNHYHMLGYLRSGNEMATMMQRIHGSIAKLVNDTLEVRLTPFWVDRGQRNYFDGCIRDELQCRRAYRYVLTQSVRHGICSDWRDYAHTHVEIDLERGIKRALELNAFLEGVPYKRYEH